MSKKSKTVRRYVGGTAENYLVLDDIEVWLGYSDHDGNPMVIISTSEDSDSWQKLDVYMNDGKAVTWE